MRTIDARHLACLRSIVWAKRFIGAQPLACLRSILWAKRFIGTRDLACLRLMLRAKRFLGATLGVTKMAFTGLMILRRPTLDVPKISGWFYLAM